MGTAEKSRFHYNDEVRQTVAAFIQDAEGGVDAFILLFQPIVESAVRNILQTHGDAEQAVIDVFFKLWRSRARLPQNESILYYILAVTRRVAIDHYRKEKRRLPGLVSTEELSGRAGTEASAPDTGLLRVELEELLQTLDPDTRMIFLEYYAQGHTAKEIAARHKMRVPTVYTRLRRAKAALQKKECCSSWIRT